MRGTHNLACRNRGYADTDCVCCQVEEKKPEAKAEEPKAAEEPPKEAEPEPKKEEPKKSSWWSRKPKAEAETKDSAAVRPTPAAGPDQVSVDTQPKI